MIRLMLALLATAALEAAEFPTRPRIMYYEYQGTKTFEAVRFNYDQAGNINSVATFSATGDLSEVEFYFYENGCVNKILKVSSGRIIGRIFLEKTPECLTKKLTEFDANGNLVSYRVNQYDHHYLVGYSEFNSSNQEISKGTYAYSGGKLIGSDFSNNDGDHTMRYNYDKNTGNFRIKHTIITREKISVVREIWFVLDDGPISQEAMKTFFE